MGGYVNRGSPSLGLPRQSVKSFHYLSLHIRPTNRPSHIHRSPSSAMPSWRDQYLSSLNDAELSNPVNMELVQTCP